MELGDSTVSSGPQIPPLMNVENAEDGIANPGRFFEQVCAVCGTGGEILADPFTAIAAMPAVTSAFRDMTGIRFEVPDFIAEKCTGCSQCWTQCPDTAIPGLVNSVEDLLDVAIQSVAGKNGGADRVKSVAKPLAKEIRKVLDAVPFKNIGEVLSAAYANVAAKLNWEPEKRAQLDREYAAVYSILAEFPLARTTPFYALPEGKQKGNGGLLSITINPEACKGCNICVDVCPEHALVTIKQDDDVVSRLRRNWDFWQKLPDTDDRFVNVSDIEEAIGVLPSLLLKKKTYRSMVGGDGACMGCGEKTAVHLVVASVEALMQPRVGKLVKRLEKLIADLDTRARALLSAGADLDLAAVATTGHVDVPIAAENKAELERLARSIKALKDLLWRYQEGPGGRGRAQLGIANSTGCSSVWASTYPFNPYPFPWVNHLFQDSPSVAIGVFEGHMRKMADNFIAIRRAELLLASDYDAGKHEPFFTAFDWRQFTDEEFGLCPPIMAIGGDGAMLDIGFQNLSRLMASGKPIRVMVLDTQVYSNTGGQACTSGFNGAGRGHVRVRRGPARQAGGPQRAGADRTGPPRHLPAPVRRRPPRT
jgi:pyruvate-ferredoxin/flavodoxin oxidoreductase